MNIFIVDTSICNIQSLKSSLNFLGINYKVSNKKSELEKATHIILPGVGSFDVAMKQITESLGLQWEAQLKRIKRDSVLGSTVSMMSVPLKILAIGSTRVNLKV